MPQPCICTDDHRSTECLAHPTCQGQHTDRTDRYRAIYVLPYDATSVMHAASEVMTDGAQIESLTLRLNTDHVPYGEPALEYVLTLTDASANLLDVMIRHYPKDV
jgi:hypothetical protein